MQINDYSALNKHIGKISANKDVKKCVRCHLGNLPGFQYKYGSEHNSLQADLNEDQRVKVFVFVTNPYTVYILTKLSQPKLQIFPTMHM